MSRDFEDMDISRALLTTTSVRFTPGTQNIKKTALEKVVERLFGLGREDAFSVDELQTNFRSLSNYTLNLAILPISIFEGVIFTGWPARLQPRETLAEE